MSVREAADQIKRLFASPERHVVRFGLVKDIDVTGHWVKVELEPEGDVTDWIRYLGLGLALGNWQAAYLPALETEVLLLATDPDCSSYVAIGGFYNGVDLPPTDFAAGTLLLEHSGGNSLLLDTDGTIYLGAKSGATGVVRKPDLQAVIDDLNAFKDEFKGHAHIGNMGAPTPLSPADVASTALNHTAAAGASTIVKAK
jgi:hypothetical protein